MLSSLRANRIAGFLSHKQDYITRDRFLQENSGSVAGGHLTTLSASDKIAPLNLYRGAVFISTLPKGQAAAGEERAHRRGQIPVPAGICSGRREIPAGLSQFLWSAIRVCRIAAVVSAIGLAYHFGYSLRRVPFFAGFFPRSANGRNGSFPTILRYPGGFFTTGGICGRIIYLS